MTHIRTFQALAVAAGFVFGAQGASAEMSGSDLLMITAPDSGSGIYTMCTRSAPLEVPAILGLMGGDSGALVLYARGTCEGALVAGWNAVAPQLCGEGTPSIGQLEEIFVSWAARHPAETGVSVREATRRAFSQAFPCRR